MSKKDEPKTMVLDLAKTLSYLSELQKTKDQVYVTVEGMALLEGVVIGGHNKVRVVSEKDYIFREDDLLQIISDKEYTIKRWETQYQEKIDFTNARIANLTKKFNKRKGWFNSLF